MAHHVAVGALVCADGVLIVHRRHDRKYAPDCWDFPGGHIESGETPIGALIRELREELGVTALVAGQPRLRITKNEDRPDGLVLDLWVISEWAGDVSNLATDEHDDLRWVGAGDLETLRFAHPYCSELVRELAPAS